MGSQDNILTKYPWQYPDSALVTLCVDCHKTTHENELIPVFIDELDKNGRYLTPCNRCSGQESFEQFWYIDNGICFRCGGARYEELA